VIFEMHHEKDHNNKVQIKKGPRTREGLMFITKENYNIKV